MSERDEEKNQCNKQTSKDFFFVAILFGMSSCVYVFFFLRANHRPIEEPRAKSESHYEKLLFIIRAHVAAQYTDEQQFPTSRYIFLCYCCGAIASSFAHLYH